METKHKIDYTKAPLSVLRAQDFLSGALQDKKPQEVEFMIINLERMVKEYNAIQEDRKVKNMLKSQKSVEDEELGGLI